MAEESQLIFNIFIYQLSTMTKLKNMKPARRRFLFTMPILSVPFSPLRSVLE